MENAMIHDKFERMVNKQYPLKDDPVEMFVDAAKGHCLLLLRRYHAQVVRVVQREGSFGRVNDGPDGEWILRNDLLAALDQLKKGTR
jgi:hypothetical protein